MVMFHVLSSSLISAFRPLPDKSSSAATGPKAKLHILYQKRLKVLITSPWRGWGEVLVGETIIGIVVPNAVGMFLLESFLVLV